MGKKITVEIKVGSCSKFPAKITLERYSDGMDIRITPTSETEAYKQVSGFHGCAKSLNADEAKALRDALLEMYPLPAAPEVLHVRYVADYHDGQPKVFREATEVPWMVTTEFCCANRMGDAEDIAAALNAKEKLQ